jgi:predicted DNA-binding protein (MmcQ/YjbR family)
MDIESLREYVLAKPSVTEGFPFGGDVLVFKTSGRMFLLLPLDTEPVRFNVKCNPERAIELREQYPAAVLPGYHMSKKHWNTVIINGSLTKAQLLEMIDHSYNLISSGK